MARSPHYPYVEAVTTALDAMPDGRTPSDWWADDSETGEDGATMTLTAVICWNGEASPDRYPHGLLVLWDLEHGWRYAGMREDGRNDWPEDLPLPLWAAPADVVAAARALLAGEPVADAAYPEWHDDAVMAAVKAWVES